MTMTVTKHNPFADFEDFPAGLRLFGDTVARLLNEPTSRPWSPAVDILETEDDLVLKADVPGIDMKNIDISLENGTLTVKGERTFEAQQEHSGYHRIERAYGKFARSFSLPETVDPDKVRAEYRNGVLSITLPKKEVAKPRTIKVEVNN
jgi:HSP20 family protein